MSHDHSSKAILYAFAANLGIAATKAGAAIWTGSGSMLAEAVHSFADCGNQILLFVGMRRAGKTANRRHPMGYGRETYIWSMMVAITLFSVGGLFSIYEGWQRLNKHHALEDTELALAILAIAIILESLSLRTALAAVKAQNGQAGLWQWFRGTHSSELMVVVGEDIAALCGLVIAAAMLGLAWLTGNVAYDAVGSMLIGALLMAVAVVVGHEVHELLVGESDTEIGDRVCAYLQQQTSVVAVLNCWAINHGNDVMLAIKAQLRPELTVAEAVTQINAIERALKQQHPRVKWIFFEIDDQA